MRALWSNASKIAGSIAFAAALALVPALAAQASGDDAATSRNLVNQVRSSEGLGSLQDESRLDSIAQAQAQRMADRDEIYHNPNLKAEADAAGVNWQWIGENVGVGPDVQAVHDGFMASSGHHENIVYPDYNVIGTGTAIGKDGSIFVAQVFAGIEQSSPATAAPAAPVVEPVVSPARETSDPKPTVTPADVPITAPVASSQPVRDPSVNVLFGGVVNPESVPVG